MKALLSKIDFFAGLDETILEEIRDASIVRQFARNEALVRQGEKGVGLHLIAKGRVKMDREQDGARMPVVELGPEQFFGAMSLLDNEPCPATVTALEDSECVLLTRDRFVKLMNKFPEIPVSMARVLAVDGVADEAAQPVALVAAANSGGLGAPVAVSTKAQIQGKLLETFKNLYAIKALSRFLIAVLGCPVEGIAVNTVRQIRMGDVKALFFPADEPVDMRIAALEPGWFTLDVFTPSSDAPYILGRLR